MSRDKVKKTSLDTIIRVNRSVRPSYPNWVERVMHPELEATGPAEYDLVNVKPWLHNGQKKGKDMDAQAIYGYLKTSKMLGSCLGLADGLEIRRKGITVFRKFYNHKAVLLWRSVSLCRDGRLFVPALYEVSGDVVDLGRCRLDFDLNESYLALRFAS